MSIFFSQSWPAFQHQLRAQWKLVLAMATGFAFVAAALSFTCQPEKYQSNGTVLVNSLGAARISSNTEGPFRNQEALLRSRRMAQKTWEHLKEKHIRIEVKNIEDFRRNVLHARQIPGSDVIELSAKASSPKLARQTAQAYMDAYTTLATELFEASIHDKTDFFENQMALAAQDLQGLNERIAYYQEQQGILDFTVESRDKIRSLLALDTAAKDVEASLAQQKSESARIQKQLKGQPSTAIADAKQREALHKLEQNLKNLETEYHTKAETYAVTNPDMLQLQGKIETLKRQVADQQILNAAQSLTIKSATDSIRAELTHQLAQSNAEVSALQHKLATLKSRHHRLAQALQKLPRQQLEYARLVLDQKSKEQLLLRLKETLAEIQLQKAAAGQQLQIVDAPNLPDKPLFPSRFELILLSGVFGALLAVFAGAGQGAATAAIAQPERLERTYGVPVLATIPWIPDTQWQNFRRRGVLEMTTATANPDLVKAYQDLTVNLKARRNTGGRNTIVVSSVWKNAGKSFLLANLAYCLAQSGERVILIDANLREPSLHHAFNHNLDYERGLPEVINTVSEALYRSSQLESEALLPIIQQAAVPSGLHAQLSYLNAGTSLENTFEFLNSKGFGALMHVLKEHYDWVLIDTPPFLESPDAAILLGYAESLLLFAEAGCDERQIMTVQQKVARLQSNIMGLVLRD